MTVELTYLKDPCYFGLILVRIGDKVGSTIKISPFALVACPLLRRSIYGHDNDLQPSGISVME